MVSRFFPYFEANGWTEVRQKSILPAFLSDRAGSFFDTLDAGLTYEQIRDKIIEKFTPTGESGLSFATLNTRFQQPGESVEAFSESISILVHKSFPHANLSEISETKSKNFVYRCLPQIQQFLLQQNVDDLTFDEAVLLAKRQENAIRQLSLCPTPIAPAVQAPPPNETKSGADLADAIKILTEKLSQPQNPTSSSTSNQHEDQTLRGRVENLERKCDQFSNQFNSIDHKLDRLLGNQAQSFHRSTPSQRSFQSRSRLHCQICNRDNHDTNQCFRNNQNRSQAPRRRSLTPMTRQVLFQEYR